MAQKPLSLLCISTYFKGANFLIGAKEAGCNVYFITAKELENKPWPREHIDEIFYLDSNENTPQNHHNLALGVAHLMRSKKIDRIIALDDFDVEKAAYLRETFRVAGMGQTTSRYFRDKLAMRMRAQDAGIKVPPFSTIFHDETVTEYLRTVEGPWLLKPRSEASATGIKKVHSLEEAWQVIHSLGDNRHNYLIEQFRPGSVYHVDALSQNGTFLFQRVSQYVNTPMEVAHGGGIFRSVVSEFGGDDDKQLQELNQKVMDAFGMKSSASHTEYIKSAATGEFYFLETAARVGGANLMEMIEASANMNLWKEWANMEIAIATETNYKLPKIKKEYAGIVISLCRYKEPDTSSFNDAEIYWRMKEDYHIGFIVKAKTRARVLEILDGYAQRIAKDFHASAPAPDKTLH